MRRWLGVVSTLFISALVSGCAVPVGVTVASWAIDGFSYVATQKSLTDHGISFITDQDCALHRVVTQMDLYAVCKELQNPVGGVTALADASDAIEQKLNKNEVSDIFGGFAFEAPSPSAPKTLVAANSAFAILADQKEPSIEDLANFDTAAGGDTGKVVPEAHKTLSIEEIANFETAAGPEDQSDFEKLEDPAARKNLNLDGIWQFIKDLI